MEVLPTPSRRYGQLTLAPLHEQPSPAGAKSAEVRQVNYVWTPAPELSQFLPKDFAIPIACFEGFGMRMFRAVNDSGALCLSASVAGLAIIESLGRLSSEQRGVYDKMRFLFQIGSQLRERLDVRPSLNEDELRVQPNDAFGVRADILPDDFGTRHNASEERWSVGRLMAEGKSAAHEHAIENPTQQEQIYYGIDAESKIRPKDVSEAVPSEIRQWLRFVLFDTGPSESAIDANLKTRVFGRFFDAMRAHLDDSTDQFNHWFFDNFDGIVHQVSKRKLPDGTIPRKDARQAIVELAFDSWGYVGQTVEVFMQSVAFEIEPLLTAGERLAFDTMYKGNSRVGDFPLFLFYEQISVVRPAILRILNAPNDPKAWGRFHRVLETYAIMLTRRRTADRNKRKAVGHRTIEWEQSPAIQSDPFSIERLDFQEIAQAFLKNHNFQCNCPTEFNWNVLHSQSETDPRRIVFQVTCLECGEYTEPIVDFEELRRFAEQYRDNCT